MKFIIFTGEAKTVSDSLTELCKDHEIVETQFTTNSGHSGGGYIQSMRYSVLVKYKVKD